PDLGRRLEERELRQLKQRVALRCEIAPLSLTETATYIANRIEYAGGVAARLFTREAVMRIHALSGGIPRTISVICDNALLHGLALGRQPVGEELVLEVCRDFAFGGNLTPSRNPRARTRDRGAYDGLEATSLLDPAVDPSTDADPATREDAGADD